MRRRLLVAQTVSAAGRAKNWRSWHCGLRPCAGLNMSTQQCWKRGGRRWMNTCGVRSARLPAALTPARSVVSRPTFAKRTRYGGWSGRVTFHLAENGWRLDAPICVHGQLHEPAVELSGRPRTSVAAISASRNTRSGRIAAGRFVALLTPIHQAAERMDWVKQLVESGGIYQPLAWMPNEA